MKKWVSYVLIFLCFSAVSYAQSRGQRGSGVSGVVLDEGDKSPVMQATVQLLSVKDSAMVTGNVSDLDGKFRLNAKPGNYLLKVSFVGYKPYFKEVKLTVARPSLNVGEVLLGSDAIMLEGAVIVAEAPEVTASEDTLVYNSSAYRVPEGSALEELVKKLPGAEIDENGKITINGKEIKKIMVDGKEFFADDPNVAMKNLPVNIVEKLRTYEKKSDLARVTGVDDGEEETVLDLTVKKGMNQGWFGNVDAAIGTKDRYSERFIINRFIEGNQFTLLGSANNVNDNGFPGGGGGFRRGAQNGLTAVKNLGFNFAAKNEKVDAGGSVNYDYRNQDLQTKSAAETFLTGESSSFKNALNAAVKKTQKINGDFRVEWTPDTLTNIIFRPRFSYGDTWNLTDNESYTFNEDPVNYVQDIMNNFDQIESMVPEEKMINHIVQRTLSDNNDLSVSGVLQANRRLGKKGRSITFRGKFGYTNSASEQFSESNTEYFQLTDPEAAAQEILNRYTTAPTKSYDYSARFMYSEPIMKDLFLQLSYNFQYKYNNSDKSVYNMADDWLIENPLPSDYTDNKDEDLSKYATYKYYNHQIDLAVRWVREKFLMNAGLSFQPQRTTLSYQKGTYMTDTVRNVFNFTPTFNFRYRFSKTSQLRINYYGRSSQPSMTNLLPIVDDTDPLNVRVGNPGLKPSFTNTLMAFYNTFDPEKQRGIMTHLRFNSVLNSVSNKMLYNSSTGGYTITPVNINGNWDMFAMLGLNSALKNKKFTINTFSMARYNNMVGYMRLEEAQAGGNDKNTTRQLTLMERLRGTYRNDWFEFSLNGSINYMHSRNSLQAQNNMDTYQFAYGASTNVNLPWNMSISTDISQNSRRGYADASMNRDELLWNAQISQNFLKGNAATVSVQVYDILRQQSNLSRTISAMMRQDTEYNSIYNYVMVHFIYRLNLFGKGAKPPMQGPAFGPGPHRMRRM